MSDDQAKDEAQRNLAGIGIGPGQIWRHYKGGLYVISHLSIKEDTLEPLVTYRSNLKEKEWTRTLGNFMEMIDTDVSYTLPDGSERMGRPRFTRVRE